MYIVYFSHKNLFFVLKYQSALIQALIRMLRAIVRTMLRKAPRPGGGATETPDPSTKLVNRTAAPAPELGWQMSRTWWVWHSVVKAATYSNLFRLTMRTLMLPTL